MQNRFFTKKNLIGRFAAVAVAGSALAGCASPIVDTIHEGGMREQGIRTPFFTNTDFKVDVPAQRSEKVEAFEASPYPEVQAVAKTARKMMDPVTTERLATLDEVDEALPKARAQAQAKRKPQPRANP